MYYNIIREIDLSPHTGGRGYPFQLKNSEILHWMLWRRINCYSFNSVPPIFTTLCLAPAGTIIILKNGGKTILSTGNNKASDNLEKGFTYTNSSFFDNCTKITTVRRCNFTTGGGFNEEVLIYDLLKNKFIEKYANAFYVVSEDNKMVAISYYVDKACVKMEPAKTQKRLL